MRAFAIALTLVSVGLEIPVYTEARDKVFIQKVELNLKLMPYSVGIVFTCVDINGGDLLFPPWLRLEVSTKTETISYDRNGSYAVYCDPVDLRYGR